MKVRQKWIIWHTIWRIFKAIEKITFDDVKADTFRILFELCTANYLPKFNYSQILSK